MGRKYVYKRLENHNENEDMVQERKGNELKMRWCYERILWSKIWNESSSSDI